MMRDAGISLCSRFPLGLLAPDRVLQLRHCATTGRTRNRVSARGMICCGGPASHAHWIPTGDSLRLAAGIETLENGHGRFALDYGAWFLPAGVLPLGPSSPRLPCLHFQREGQFLSLIHISEPTRLGV